MAQATTVAPTPSFPVLPPAAWHHSPRPIRGRTTRRRWWPPLEFAAACVLILALLGLALGPGDWWRRGSAPEADPSPISAGSLPGTPAEATAASQSGNAQPALAPAKLWRLNLRPFGGTRPAIADGLVVLPSITRMGEAVVLALDARTGDERWATRIDHESADGFSLSTPVIIEGTVYVGGAGIPPVGGGVSDVDGFLVAIDAATGDLRWQSTIGGISPPKPVAASGSLYVLGNEAANQDADTPSATEPPIPVPPGNGFLATVDLTSGESQRIVTIGAIPATGFATDGSMLFVGAIDGVRAFALDGTERWFFRLPLSIPDPIVENGTVYQAAWSDVVIAIDATTGTERWRTRAGRSIALGSQQVFAFGEQVEGWGLVALDPETGDRRWRIPMPTAESDLETVFLADEVGGPFVASGIVYVVNFGADVVAFDAATGEERWRFEVAGTPFGAPVASDGVVYVMTEGALIAVVGPTVTFVATHRTSTESGLILRAEPTSDATIETVLPPGTPLRSLGESATVASGEVNEQAVTWLKFETGDGQVGWVREIDVEPLPATPTG